MNVDQVICPKCHGKKYLKYRSNEKFKSRLLCHKCQGAGVIEWLDVIFNRTRFFCDNWEIYDRRNNEDSIVCEEMVL